MSKPEFEGPDSGGYWVYSDDPTFGLSSLRALIKITGEGWYAGAAEDGQSTVPLYGPYRLRRTAKRKALEQLALLREYRR